MFHIHLFLVSLLCIFNVLLLAESPTQNKDHTKHIKITPLYEPEIPESPRKTINEKAQKQNSKPMKEVSIFSQEEIRDMEFVLKWTPIFSQSFAGRLQEPDPHNLKYKKLFIIDELGVTNKKLGNAIGYKLTTFGWNCKFLSGTELLEANSQVKLLGILKDIKISCIPTVLIIHDFDRLTDSNDSNYDTNQVIQILENFVDQYPNNKEFLLVATMKKDNLPKNQETEYFTYTNRNEIAK